MCINAVFSLISPDLFRMALKGMQDAQENPSNYLSMPVIDQGTLGQDIAARTAWNNLRRKVRIFVVSYVETNHSLSIRSNISPT